MNRFWTGWVVVLGTLNLGVMLFLFIWALRLRIPTQPDDTTGHVWAHGVLREGVRKLPAPWVVFSVFVLLFSAIYLGLYPGLGGLRGVLGWSSLAELQRASADNATKGLANTKTFRELSIEALAANELATKNGHRLFVDNCAACHGSLARGNQLIGAPDLTDADSLYGDADETLLTSIRDGRHGTMPPWGAALPGEGVQEVASYVLSMSGVHAPEDWVAAGKVRFEQLCASCHGVDGRGNAALGAPNLSDARWLYGGDFASVARSIRDGRNGVMPAWRGRLSDDEIRLIAGWIYSQRAAGGTR